VRVLLAPVPLQGLHLLANRALRLPPRQLGLDAHCSERTPALALSKTEVQKRIGSALLALEVSPTAALEAQMDQPRGALHDRPVFGYNDYMYKYTYM
jgi:hypothetical protein